MSTSRRARFGAIGMRPTVLSRIEGCSKEIGRISPENLSYEDSISIRIGLGGEFDGNS